MVVKRSTHISIRQLWTIFYLIHSISEPRPTLNRLTGINLASCNGLVVIFKFSSLYFFNFFFLSETDLSNSAVFITVSALSTGIFSAIFSFSCCFTWCFICLFAALRHFFDFSPYKLKNVVELGHYNQKKHKTNSWQFAWKVITFQN